MRTKRLPPHRNPIDRLDASDKAFHVRACLLENLSPEQWDLMDAWGYGRDYWQHCSLLDLKVSIARLGEVTAQQGHTVDRDAAARARRELFGP